MKHIPIWYPARRTLLQSENCLTEPTTRWCRPRSVRLSTIAIRSTAIRRRDGREVAAESTNAAAATANHIAGSTSIIINVAATAWPDRRVSRILFFFFLESSSKYFAVLYRELLTWTTHFHTVWISHSFWPADFVRLGKPAHSEIGPTFFIFDVL